MKPFAIVTLHLFSLFASDAQDQSLDPAKTGLVPYKDYMGLLGEELSGNVFVIRHNGELLACMSRHQFEDEKVPSRAEDIDGPAVPLDQTRVYKQRDVQILPLANLKQSVQFLDYDSDYELKAGEELWIERGPSLGKSDGTIGRLRDTNLLDRKFSPRDGAKELTIDLDETADVRGASGSPVIQVSTGKPIGVLLAADDGESASYIVFEPICLVGVLDKAEDSHSPAPLKGPETQRNWTNANGQSVTARLTNIDAESKSVSLEREDGKTFVIPIASLSLGDQTYVREALPQFTWTIVPAAPKVSAGLNLALQSLGIGEVISVKTVERSRESSMELRKSAPLGYQERHFYSHPGDVLRQYAIDESGNLLFMEAPSGPNRPYSLTLVTRSGQSASVYETPALEETALDKPHLDADSKLAALPDGGYFLSANWVKISERTATGVSTLSSAGEFDLALGGTGLATKFVPTRVDLPLQRGMQTLTAFAGDRIITKGLRNINASGIALYDKPKPTSIDGPSVSSPSDTSWEFPPGLVPLQVVGKSQVIVVGNSNETRLVFLLDFQTRTFSTLGLPANSKAERARQLTAPVVSPGGTYLVHYNEFRGAFMWLKLESPSD